MECPKLVAYNDRAWRWQGIVAGQAHNKCKIKNKKYKL